MAGTGKGPLRIAFEDFLTTTKIGIILHGWYTDLIESIEQGIAGDFKPFLDQLKGIPGVPDVLDPNRYTGPGGTHQGGIAALLGFGLNMGMSAASAFMAPFMRLLNYKLDAKLHTARLDPSPIFAAGRQDPHQIELFFQDLIELGYTPERIEAIRKAFLPTLDESTIVSLFFRKIIDEPTANDELRKRGWTEKYWNWIKTGAKVIPNVQDLIRLAVREAWNDQVASRFQYDADLPGEVSEWGAKQGLEPDWIKRYWRAHWELPSPTIAYEMVHRLRPGKTSNPFTVDDMRLLLRTADYPPFWRDRLIEISYNPYTRVDVRRMYKLGILNQQQVYDSYRDIGYDDAHAKNLTDFTIKYETGTDETKPDIVWGMAKSIIVDAYQRKVIDKTKAVTLMQGLHVEDDLIEAILRMADLDRLTQLKPDYEKEYITSLKKLVSNAYVSGTVTKEDAIAAYKNIGLADSEAQHLVANDDYEVGHAILSDNLKTVGEGYANGAFSYTQTIQMLGKLNITGTQQAKLFETWNIAKNVRTRRLTEAQYRAAFESNIIKAEDYKQAIIDLGYSDKDVDILVRLYTVPKPPTA